MSRLRSEKFFQKALQLIPGGVNSPVRAFGGVGGTPIFFHSAHGAYLQDVNGNTYLDYVGSWGPMILGHAHPKVIAAVQQTITLGSSFGAPSPLELEMAQILVKRIPGLEQVRMVNSGTEAVMGALRLARGYTGRNKIIKFEGCYHGHADYLLVKAGSGALTHGRPDSLGVPSEMTYHTLLAPYNDLGRVQRLAKRFGKDLAAIVVEPVAGNMGVVLPKKEFLLGLRKVCRHTGALLIFDEVMTGFRIDPAGAQGRFGIRPDLTILGKIIGGGLPVGAYGGPKKIMKFLSPLGGVYQAGTLSGNPVAMAAGIATLKQLSSPKVYQKLAQKTERLARGLGEAAETAGLSVQVPFVCGMLSLFFSKRRVENLTQAQKSRTDLYPLFFHAMMDRGVYLPPSPYEAWFLSLTHGENEIAKTLRAAKDSFLLVKEHTRKGRHG
jgi:glutamate-1-semialdehyde 2,1-aminomutase